MRATVWGCRGSIASPGAETVRYGGNTACVEIRPDDGPLIVLDAGTGIRRLAVR
jgi:phosphoribosyl 1,2-cyclic phosphodiesterase